MQSYRVQLIDKNTQLPLPGNIPVSILVDGTSSIVATATTSSNGVVTANLQADTEYSVISAASGIVPYGFRTAPASSILGSGAFNVVSNGAVGDGVTDNFAAFNRTIAQMPAPLTQPASGGFGPAYTGSFGSVLLIPQGNYYLSAIPNFHSGNIGCIVSQGAVMTGPGALYPSQLYLVAPGSTSYPREPAMLYITEPIPSNRSSLSPQNDDVTGIHLEHYNSGRAGIAIDSQGSGDGIFIGLSAHSYYGLDIVSYAGSPAPSGPMVVLNNSSAQDMNIISINDYQGGVGAGRTIFIDNQRSGSVGTIGISHTVSTYSGNFIDISAGGSGGTFNGNFLNFGNGGSSAFIVDSHGRVSLGANGLQIIPVTGVPTFSARGGTVAIRDDGSLGARVYINQASSGSGTSWIAISGV